MKTPSAKTPTESAPDKRNPTVLLEPVKRGTHPRLLKSDGGDPPTLCPIRWFATSDMPPCMGARCAAFRMIIEHFGYCVLIEGDTR